MTNKDIQQLIDRYLEGETSPEEEKVLARELLRSNSSPARGEVAEGQRGGSPEWQAICLMLGELAMGEAEYDDIMAERVNPVATEPNVRESLEKSEARMVSMKWRWIAAAASLLLLIGTCTMLLMKENDTMPLVAQKIAEEMTAQPLPALQGEGCPKGGAGSVVSTPQVKVTATAMNHQEEKIQTPPLTPPLEGRGVAAQSLSLSSPSTEDPNIHYASLEKLQGSELCSGMTTTDTVAYQDPARVDEFISKLASVYALPIELTCSATLDSTVTSAVYVFPDKTTVSTSRPTVSTSRQEVDVFGRLLQVAICYSDETPGYQLNFSHLQFFFQLKDTRRQLQYLWIAERVNGKILLYSTHSPIGTNVSSACYQEYRDELMHTKSIHTKTLDI